jgi:hypothetical protein
VNRLAKNLEANRSTLAIDSTQTMTVRTISMPLGLLLVLVCIRMAAASSSSSVVIAPNGDTLNDSGLLESGGNSTRHPALLAYTAPVLNEAPQNNAVGEEEGDEEDDSEDDARTRALRQYLEEREEDPNLAQLGECGLYLAPSTVPGAGLGLFAGHDFTPGSVITRGDIVVPIVDLQKVSPDDFFLWDEYT